MTGATRLIEDLTARFAALFGEADHPNEGVAPENVLEFVAELAARRQAGESHGPSAPATAEYAARLAGYLDGGLDDSVRRQFEALLASSPADLQDMIASLAYLDDLDSRRASAPADLADAAIAAWRDDQAVAPSQADVIPFRRGGLKPAASGAGPSAPAFDSFQLLAAAGGADHPAVLCRSQSGLWTLEVFVGTSKQDEEAGRGYLLLAVHPDHRATYEGRSARVFVMIGNEERVLAEAPVRDGEVYAAISLSGLDLWTRDAVNVVFSPERQNP